MAVTRVCRALKESVFVTRTSATTLVTAKESVLIAVRCDETPTGKGSTTKLRENETCTADGSNNAYISGFFQKQYYLGSILLSIDCSSRGVELLMERRWNSVRLMKHVSSLVLDPEHRDPVIRWYLVLDLHSHTSCQDTVVRSVVDRKCGGGARDGESREHEPDRPAFACSVNSIEHKDNLTCKIVLEEAPASAVNVSTSASDLPPLGRISHTDTHVLVLS